jgi:hypothetical protein
LTHDVHYYLSQTPVCGTYERGIVCVANFNFRLMYSELIYTFQWYMVQD